MVVIRAKMLWDEERRIGDANEDGNGVVMVTAMITLVMVVMMVMVKTVLVVMMVMVKMVMEKTVMA